MAGELNVSHTDRYNYLLAILVILIINSLHTKPQEFKWIKKEKIRLILIW